MKSVRSALIGATIATLAAMPVSAGGLAPATIEPEVAAPAIVPVPSYSTRFAGGYVGGGLGYAFRGDDKVGIIGPAGTVTAGDMRLKGALAEVHAGYRWQPGVIVWGLELGAEGGNVEADASGFGQNSDTELKYAVTLRSSLGYTLNDDTLLYGFAGVSRAKFDYSISGVPMNLDQRVSRTGYVVGLGVERALSEKWSLRGEYQYSNYGKERLTDAAGFQTNVTPKYHSVRVGVNYSF